LGFYIHSCPKMRYKGRYSPSFLACPETYAWQPMEACRPLLDRAAYSRLDPNPAAVDRDLPRDQLDLGVLCNRKATDYQGYRTMVASQGGDPEQDNEEVSEYAALVGERVGKRMLLYRTNL